MFRKIWYWIESRYFPKPKYSNVLVPPKDDRDWVFKPTVSSSTVREDIDLRDSVLSLRYQADKNSCTGFCVAAHMETLSKGLFGGFPFRISPLYQWHIGQERHGWQGTNTGVDLRESFKALFKECFIPEDLYPYSGNLLRSIPDSVRSQAKSPLIRRYLNDFGYYLVRHRDITKALHQGLPVTMGIWLNKDFETKKKKYIEDNLPADKNKAHACLIVGKEGEHYIVANWWGSRYGENGYWFVHEDYVEANAFHKIVIYYKRDVVK